MEAQPITQEEKKTSSPSSQPTQTATPEKETGQENLYQTASLSQTAGGGGGNEPGPPSNPYLPGSIQQKMETALGEDFSGVNVYRNSSAAANMGAEAYAQGNDIHFAPGKSNLGSNAGQELLGHELAHIAQQRKGKGGTHFATSGQAETQADHLANLARMGKPIPSKILPAKFGSIQKKEAEPDTPEYSSEQIKRNKKWTTRERIELEIDADGDGKRELKLRLQQTGRDFQCFADMGGGYQKVFDTSIKTEKSLAIRGQFFIKQQIPRNVNSPFQLVFLNNSRLSIAAQPINQDYYFSLSLVEGKNELTYTASLPAPQLARMPQNANRMRMKDPEYVTGSGENPFTDETEISPSSEVGFPVLSFIDNTHQDRFRFQLYKSQDPKTKKSFLSFQVLTWDKERSQFDVAGKNMLPDNMDYDFKDLRFRVDHSWDRAQLILITPKGEEPLMEIGSSIAPVKNEEYDSYGRYNEEKEMHKPTRDERYLVISVKNFKTDFQQNYSFYLLGNRADGNLKIPKGRVQRHIIEELQRDSRLDAHKRFSEMPYPKDFDRMLNLNYDSQVRGMFAKYYESERQVREQAKKDNPGAAPTTEDKNGLYPVINGWFEFKRAFLGNLERENLKTFSVPDWSMGGTSTGEGFLSNSFPKTPGGLRYSRFIAAYTDFLSENWGYARFEGRYSQDKMMDNVFRISNQFTTELRSVFQSAPVSTETNPLSWMDFIDTLNAADLVLIRALTQFVNPDAQAEGNDLWKGMAGQMEHRDKLDQQFHEKIEKNGNSNLLPIKAYYYPKNDNNELKIQAIPLDLIVYYSWHSRLMRDEDLKDRRIEVAALSPKGIHYESFDVTKDWKKYEQLGDHHQELMNKLNDADFLPPGVIQYAIEEEKEGKTHQYTGQVEITGENDDSVFPTWMSLGAAALGLGLSLTPIGWAGTLMYAVAGAMNATNSIFKLKNDVEEGRGLSFSNIAHVTVDLVTNLCDWTGSYQAIRALKNASVVTMGGKMGKAFRGIKVWDFRADVFGFLLFEAETAYKLSEYLTKAHESGQPVDPYTVAKMVAFMAANGLVGLYTGFSKSKDIKEMRDMQGMSKQMYKSDYQDGIGKSSQRFDEFESWKKLPGNKGKTAKDYQPKDQQKRLSEQEYQTHKTNKEYQEFEKWKKTADRPDVDEYNKASGKKLTEEGYENYKKSDLYVNAQIQKANKVTQQHNLDPKEHKELINWVEEYHKKGGNWLDDGFKKFVREKLIAKKPKNEVGYVFKLSSEERKLIKAMEKEQGLYRDFYLIFRYKYGLDLLAGGASQKLPAFPTMQKLGQSLKLMDPEKWAKKAPYVKDPFDLDQMVDLYALHRVYKGDVAKLKQHFEFLADKYPKLAPAKIQEFLIQTNGNVMKAHKLILLGKHPIFKIKTKLSEKAEKNQEQISKTQNLDKSTLAMVKQVKPLLEEAGSQQALLAKFQVMVQQGFDKTLPMLEKMKAQKLEYFREHEQKINKYIRRLLTKKYGLKPRSKAYDMQFARYRQAFKKQFLPGRIAKQKAELTTLFKTVKDQYEQLNGLLAQLQKGEGLQDPKAMAELMDAYMANVVQLRKKMLANFEEVSVPKVMAAPVKATKFKKQRIPHKKRIQFPNNGNPPVHPVKKMAEEVKSVIKASPQGTEKKIQYGDQKEEAFSQDNLFLDMQGNTDFMTLVQNWQKGGGNNAQSLEEMFATQFSNSFKQNMTTWANHFDQYQELIKGLAKTEQKTVMPGMRELEQDINQYALLPSLKAKLPPNLANTQTQAALNDQSLTLTNLNKIEQASSTRIASMNAYEDLLNKYRGKLRWLNDQDIEAEEMLPLLEKVIRKLDLQNGVKKANKILKNMENSGNQVDIGKTLYAFFQLIGDKMDDEKLKAFKKKYALNELMKPYEGTVPSPDAGLDMLINLMIQVQME